MYKLIYILCVYLSLTDMNQTTDTLQKVYKKDGEGVTYAVSQAVFEGHIIDFACSFPDVGRQLTEMKSFMPQDNDVMLITYPRSGMITQIVQIGVFYVYISVNLHK